MNKKALVALRVPTVSKTIPEGYQCASCRSGAGFVHKMSCDPPYRLRKVKVVVDTRIHFPPDPSYTGPLETLCGLTKGSSLSGLREMVTCRKCRKLQKQPPKKKREAKKKAPKILSLKALKSCIDQAWANAGEAAEHAGVEVWLGDQAYRIVSVGQFGIVPDVTLTIKKEGN